MKDRLRLMPVVLAIAVIAILAVPSMAVPPLQETEVLEEEALQEAEVVDELEGIATLEEIEKAEAREVIEVPQTSEEIPIIVGPPETVGEAKLQNAVRLALLEHLEDDAFSIRITVDGTSVILTGAVLYRSTQELATEVVKSVAGVHRVRNMIRISPDAPGAGDNPAKKAGSNTGDEVSDAGMETWVKTRLFDAVGRRAFSIEVEVTGGAVSLRGTVDSEGYKVLAVEAAESVTGIWKVIDLIKVVEKKK